MNPYQRARRAGKSNAFFAKRAEFAAREGDPSESARLIAASRRKRGDALIAKLAGRLQGDERLWR